MYIGHLCSDNHSIFIRTAINSYHFDTNARVKNNDNHAEVTFIKTATESGDTRKRLKLLNKLNQYDTNTSHH